MDIKMCGTASENSVTNQLLDVNPKTVYGAAKPPLMLVPRTALIHEAMAFADGAGKYGPYNWREKAVSSMTYLHACSRHIAQYLDREDIDRKSLVHHLGHARACLAVILDAEAVGNLIDDRPPAAPTSALLEQLTKEISDSVRDGSGSGTHTGGSRKD